MKYLKYYTTNASANEGCAEGPCVIGINIDGKKEALSANDQEGDVFYVLTDDSSNHYLRNGITRFTYGSYLSFDITINSMSNTPTSENQLMIFTTSSIKYLNRISSNDISYGGIQYYGYEQNVYTKNDINGSYTDKLYSGMAGSGCLIDNVFYKFTGKTINYNDVNYYIINYDGLEDNYYATTNTSTPGTYSTLTGYVFNYIPAGLSLNIDGFGSASYDESGNEIYEGVQLYAYIVPSTLQAYLGTYIYSINNAVGSFSDMLYIKSQGTITPIGQTMEYTITTVEETKTLATQEDYSNVIITPNDYFNISELTSYTYDHYMIFKNCKKICTTITDIFDTQSGKDTYNIPYIVDTILFSTGNTGIWYIELSEGIKHLSNYSFYNDAVLYKAILPKSLLLISDYAFYGCSDLEIINCENVKLLGYSAFSLCNLLLYIDISNIVTIPLNAFEGCYNLKTVILSNLLSNINLMAFEGCANITFKYDNDMVSAKGITGYDYFPPCKIECKDGDIYKCAFIFDNGTEYMTDNFSENSVIYEALNNPNTVSKLIAKNYSSIDYQSNLSTLFGTAAWQANTDGITLVIDEPNTEIADNFFYTGVSQITPIGDLQIANTITKIGNSAFYNSIFSDNITINIPKSVTLIDNSAFSGCCAAGGTPAHMTFNIESGSNLRIIEDNAFTVATDPSYTKFGSIWLPSSLTYVSTAAFPDSGGAYPGTDDFVSILFEGTLSLWESITEIRDTYKDPEHPEKGYDIKIYYNQSK